MKLSELKTVLEPLKEVAFKLPNGELVPRHFHVTEVGQIDKNFIDCGGTIRNERVISLQLWSANDYDHRLHPEKLVHIITLSEEKLGLEDLEVEVEYQGTTIQKFGLDFEAGTLLLTTKHTDCLAKEACGIPEKPKVKLSEIQTASSCCTPESGCC